MKIFIQSIKLNQSINQSINVYSAEYHRFDTDSTIDNSKPPYNRLTTFV